MNPTVQAKLFRPKTPWHVALVVGATLASLLSPGESRSAPSPDPATSSEFSTAAAVKRIDHLVARAWEQKKRTPPPQVDDAAFVRRTYLGIVGRIPTFAEAESFTKDATPGKRERLVDALLDAPGHVSHTFNWLADLFRVKSRLGNQISGEPYVLWLKDAVASNKPWDQMAREMLTATGAAYARGNGATGYFLRDRGMPEDNLANTVRVFLGTRLECAQCHNHPFDKWKQKDFFHMAAFVGGLQYTTDLARSPEIRKLRQASQRLRQSGSQAAYRSLRVALIALSAGVSHSGSGLVRLPKDYKYDDAKPREWVEAKTLFGDKVQLDATPPRERRFPNVQRRQGQGRRDQGPPTKEIGSRNAYAEWMTSPKNPRFTKVIANRMWKRVMGLGLIEPVDGLTDKSKPSDAALMAYLEKLMVEVRYDLKEFLRILYRTEAARRAPAGDEGDVAMESVRRLSAEQLWDSLLTLVLPDPDTTLTGGDKRAEAIFLAYERLSKMSADDLLAQAKEGGDRPGGLVRMLRGQAPQEEREAEQKARQSALREARPLLLELRRAQRTKNLAAEAKIMAQLREKGINLDPRAGRRRGNNALVRASELDQPAPDGHFLREFGQSDRDQIEGSHTDPAVPQVLSLMNGFLEDFVLNPQSRGYVLEIVGKGDTVQERIRAAYVAILTREPTPTEMETWTRDVEKLRGDAYADLVWTLVNSHEFRLLP